MWVVNGAVDVVLERYIRSVGYVLESDCADAIWDFAEFHELAGNNFVFWLLEVRQDGFWFWRVFEFFDSFLEAVDEFSVCFPHAVEVFSCVSEVDLLEV